MATGRCLVSSSKRRGNGKAKSILLTNLKTKFSHMSDSPKSNSRRNFIRNTSIAATGFFIVPRHVLGKGFVAPSDKLNIAGIGAGGKGESDLNEFFKSGKANIYAMADVDDRQAVA